MVSPWNERLCTLNIVLAVPQDSQAGQSHATQLSYSGPVAVGDFQTTGRLPGAFRISSLSSKKPSPQYARSPRCR